MTGTGFRGIVELEVDEAQELVERLRTEGVMEAGGNEAVWWIVLCVIGLLVAAALLVLAGQKRRARAYDEDEPAFDGYDVKRDDYDDDFAAVQIEERPAPRTMPWQARVEEPDEQPENVVPIRKIGVSEPMEPEPEPEEAPARYAFASGGAPGAAPAYQPPQPPQAPQPPQQPAPPAPQDYAPRRQETRMSAFDDRQRDDQPFIAPFIREDIERAERRQAERIEGLRDEVSREFRAMKSESAARLDLFVSAVDRKLDGMHGGGAAFGESDLQRVTEGSVRPVFERLERLTTQVATQEQRLGDLAQLIELRLGDLPSVRADLHETTALVTRLRDQAGETQDRLDTLTDLVREQSGATGQLDHLREGLTRLERAILDRASEDGSASVALSEVVRGTLAEGSYAFGKRLPNGETADCLITFEGHAERIAIDAGFPMEAFDQLPSRDAVRRNLPQAKAAEDTFRRAILRAILTAADRCIVPGETTDSCLLFLPSEAAYTTLHDRFGDLVRDAQRARVWLTSPSTLMGTLNLLSNLMGSGSPALRERDDEAEKRETEAREAEDRRAAEAARRERVRSEADKREAERRAMREEIKALRERAAGLAGELDRTRGTLSELIDTTERLSGADDGYEAPGWSEDDREERYED